MKLRDRVVVGFCLSLVLVTVLFVVDLQNENARRMAIADLGVGFGGDGDGGGDLHGRSNARAPSVWDTVMSTLVPPPPGQPEPPPPPPPRHPAAPQPYVRTAADSPPPDPYADDRFRDLTERLSRPGAVPRRGPVADWTEVRDVIVDDSRADEPASNEHAYEFLEKTPG